MWKQLIGSHGLGIFSNCWLWPLTSSSVSYGVILLQMPYISLISHILLILRRETTAKAVALFFVIWAIFVGDIHYSKRTTCFFLSLSYFVILLQQVLLSLPSYLSPSTAHGLVLWILPLNTPQLYLQSMYIKSIFFVTLYTQWLMNIWHCDYYI